MDAPGMDVGGVSGAMAALTETMNKINAKKYDDTKKLAEGTWYAQHAQTLAQNINRRT